MAYEFFKCGRTEFAVDWSVVYRLLRSYHRARLQFRDAREVTLSESTWYNPLSWSLPDVSHVEVDWESVHKGATYEADGEIDEMQRASQFDAAGVARRLEAYLDVAAQNKELFIDWMGDVQSENMRRINQAVDDYESHADVARFVRDRSADGLMVGASIMTGGAAVAVMGGGSFLKGVGKFEDTGSMGAASMEAVGSFVFAYVKLGKKFSFKQDMVLALVQAPWKAGTELAGGAGLGKAVASGALKLTGPSVDRLVAGAGKFVFDRVPLPVTITCNGEDVTSTFLGKYAAKVTQSWAVEKKGRDAMLSVGPRSPTVVTTAVRKRAPILEQTTLTNKYLLYLSFVNMELGIGRGW